MTNETLFEQAEKAINDLFSDSSVSLEICLTNMQALKDGIDINMAGLRDDIRRLEETHD